ncbi:TatD DNase family Scn1 [Thelephora terrestris]|uniref:TatD DNase family Scn1 n=1 Tax=Thelephora terrestris TaxID=56493 RepID=A0A9P6L6L3_9AGAM|nr:TatD DNase family Scn1 [Thelephora terrestris]
MEFPPPSVLAHVVDVHCHPTDTDIPDGFPEDLHITICAMSAQTRDQPLVRELTAKCPERVIPAFGYHPWWAHQIALTKPESKRKHYESILLSSSPSEEDLVAFEKVLESQPEPRLFDDILSEVRKNLLDFPNALVGEIGLDRAVRIPYDYDATPRILTRFTIPVEHQLKIFETQLELAVELRRSVSMHCVKAHDATISVFARMAKKFGDKFWDVSVDLHSCGVSPQVWKDIEKKYCNIFISLSAIHNTRSENHKKLIETVSPQRLLIESDYNTMSELTPQTIKMLNTVSKIKGWPIEQEWTDDGDIDGVGARLNIPEGEWGAVRRLEVNWKAFLKGGHRPEQKVLSKFKRFQNDWVSDDEA